MDQPQRRFQHMDRDRQGRRGRGVAGLQPWLDQLQVIVGKLVPGELIEYVDRRTEFEALE